MNKMVLVEVYMCFFPMIPSSSSNIVSRFKEKLLRKKLGFYHRHHHFLQSKLVKLLNP